MGRWWLAAAAVVAALGVRPALAWDDRALCNADGGCVRAGLLAVSPLTHGFEITWRDARGANGDYVFRPLQVLPSGRYVAYIVTSHGSACEDFGILRAFDTERRRFVDLPDRDARWKVVDEKHVVTHDEAFEWESDSVISLEQREWRSDDCFQGGHEVQRRFVRVRM